MGVIYLIGFMGSGKSTLGRALGTLEGWHYIDLDEAMELRQGCSVSGIFREKGEEWFRSEESRLLRELGAGSAEGKEAEVLVIGCGGGTPCHGGNMEWMNTHGTTVLLRAGHDALLRRLLEAQEQRPLLRGMTPAQLADFIEGKQQEREPYYGQAQLELPSDLLETEQEIAHTVEAFLRLLQSGQPK